MNRSLLLFMTLLVSGALLVNCSSDSGGSPAAPETHDSEDVDQSSEDDVQNGSDITYDENGRPINLRPNTGLNLSYANGDYNVADTAQILVFDFHSNTTRVVVEQRYFKQSGHHISNVGCDVLYYTHNSKRIEQLASENGLSVQEVLVIIAEGNAGQRFGGSYNPDGHWYFQASFVNNVYRCQHSIACSGLMESVHAGRARLTWGDSARRALHIMNDRDL